MKTMLLKLAAACARACPRTSSRPPPTTPGLAHSLSATLEPCCPTSSHVLRMLRSPNQHPCCICDTVPTLVAAAGGNCANVCELGTEAYEDCLDEHGCEDATECSTDCQECVDDVYAECGGCDDWDTETGPAVKERVEAFGCGGASQAAPVFVVGASLLGHFFN
eukprot:COSAG02_NODE_756_length_17532_cov_5.673550_19_plen_164_part_00